MSLFLGRQHQFIKLLLSVGVRLLSAVQTLTDVHQLGVECCHLLSVR